MLPVPPRATGTVTEHPWKDGRTVTFRLRVRANGQRYPILLGTNHEGWSRERAEVEAERIVGMIERGTWQPPGGDAPAVAEASEPDLSETMHVTASRWWAKKKLDIAPTTESDYLWRLKLVIAFFGDDLTSSVDAKRVDEFAAILAKRRTQHGRPMTNRSVNMALDTLAAILDLAVDYKLLDVNPARGKGRRMKVKKTRRTFLEPDMVIDLLDVAGEWEDDLRRRKRPDQCYGRRALLALLCLAGPRIDEALQAPRADLDVHGGRLRVGAKTPAGERDIELSAFLLDELRPHLATAQPTPQRPIFHSRTGNALNPSNIRTRLIAECVDRANERRGEAGKILIPDKVTPHALRRTFASLALAAGRDPRWVMAQLGHTDARLTLNVYAQVIQRQRVDRDLIWRLMRFPDEQEAAPMPGRIGPMNGPTGPVAPSEAGGRILDE